MSVVVCVGSLHHDVLVRAARRPLAGETLMGERSWTAFGGKGGNQALTAARAGASVRMMGAVGGDTAGSVLLATLDEVGVERKHVRVLPGPSGMSVAVIDPSGDYGAVVVSNANARIEPAWLEDAALWEGAAVLLLQNEVPETVNLAAAQRARAAGARVVLNAAPFRPLTDEFMPWIDVLMVNALEAEALGAGRVTSARDALRAAATLAGRFPLAVVTAGPEGAAMAEGGNILHAPALPIEVVSAHGAGDAFAGSFGAALAQGRSHHHALGEAVVAAGRLVAWDGPTDHGQGRPTPAGTTPWV